jgi:nucleotide-binding universal stress UspA family protein
MKILIAYDGSDFAKAILDDLRYAGLPPRAEVVVITLAEPEYYLVGKKTEGVVQWLSYRLIEARSSARLAWDRIRADFPGWDVTFEAGLAAPLQEIVRKVAEWNPDLVIIGQHGREGSKRAGLGRIARACYQL